MIFKTMDDSFKDRFAKIKNKIENVSWKKIVNCKK